MKRVFLSITLMMAVIFAFAQTKTVKDAEKIAKESNPDFAKAQQLINQALQDPESKDDPATWNVAGLIQRRINEKEMEKAYLAQPYDTVRAYNSIYEMFNYYLKADDLAEVPDEKGKVRNKFRKANKATMIIERPNLINGGIYNFNTNNNEQAYKFFGMYIDSSTHPMFAAENYLQNDTLLAEVAYYASLAAARMEDYNKVLKYAKYGENHPEVGKFAMEFAATAYKELGDTVQWVETLKEGVQKYPDHAFFFGHLIDYYSNNNKYDEAMIFANNMLAKEPNNTFYLYVKAFLYHNMADYDNAIDFYKKTIEVDPTYAEAYSNLGLIYTQKAQAYSETATFDLDDPNYAKDQEAMRNFYEQARPYYEKARELKPDQQDLWIQGLYRVYYNLNMGTEFDEIEKLMGL